MTTFQREAVVDVPVGARAVVGRLRVLTVGRLLAGLAVGIAAPILGWTDVTGAGRSVADATLAYLVLNVGLFALLRVRPASGRRLLVPALVVDAVWIGAVVMSTGGTGSPFVFLAHLQLVASTVLFGRRAGFPLALADTVGLAVIVATGAVPELDLGEGVVAASTLWAITAATAYVSSVNERDLRRSNRELAVLRELSIELERSLAVDDVCEAMARGVVRPLGFRRSIVWMARDGALVPVSLEGFDPDEGEAVLELRLPTGAGIVGETVAAGMPRRVTRGEIRPGALADAFEVDSTLVLAPLRAEGRLLGLLTAELAPSLVRSSRPRTRDLRILATLATEASLALENARLHEELRDLSVTDALTGLYNHRYFQQRLQEELDRATRQSGSDQPPLSLIILDLDHFKRVNDRFGHPSGDELLRALATLMARVLRSSDIVCRYGGEEFAVILPETSVDEALQVAERLREAVERSQFAGTEGRHLGAVTASLGIDTYVAGAVSRSGVIQRADEALYAAKRGGRNRVVHAVGLAGEPGRPEASAG